MWIDATNEEKIYALDVDSKEIVRIVKGVPTTKKDVYRKLMCQAY